MPALQGELRWGAGGTALFALPQDEVHEAAEQREGEGHPGQHVGVAEAAALHLKAAVEGGPVKLCTPVGDFRTGILTGQELDDGGQHKPLPLLQAEELQDEDEKGHAAKTRGQDHRGLH
ncbi:hypothetical protein L345_17892, partial [Ophiophagus hannah]